MSEVELKASESNETENKAPTKKPAVKSILPKDLDLEESFFYRINNDGKRVEGWYVDLKGQPRIRRVKTVEPTSLGQKVRITANEDGYEAHVEGFGWYETVTETDENGNKLPPEEFNRIGHTLTTTFDSVSGADKALEKWIESKNKENAKRKAKKSL